MDSLLICCFCLWLVCISATTTYNCNNGNDLFINDPNYVVTCCDQDFSVTFGTAISTVVPITCDHLASVTLGDSVTTIDSYAFYGVSSLKTLIFGTGLQEIGAYAFSHTSLGDVIIPNSVTVIGGGAFYNATLTSVTFGSGLSTVSASTFEYSSVSTVVFSNSIEKIESLAFGYSSVTNIVWGSNLQSIQSFAFVGFKGETLTLPDSLKSIADNAFSATSSTSVVFGAGIQSIGSFAFYSAANLESIAFTGENLTLIDSYCFNSANLLSLTVPRGVVTIGTGAFSQNAHLSYVELPDTLEVIGNMSFVLSAELTSIHIPDSVEYIGQGAFAYSTLLVCLTWNTSVSRYVSPDAFSGCPLTGCPTTPTVLPSIHPTRFPSVHPSITPSRSPSALPSLRPSALPSRNPTQQPTSTPTFVDCPIGYVHDFNGAECHFCECKPCLPGQYAPIGSVVCIDSPPGYFSPINATDYIACLSGTYSRGFQAECTSTPAGYYTLNGASEPLICPPNTYSTGGQEVCTHCPVGVVSAAGSTSVSSCVSPNSSFGIAFVCLAFSLVGFYVYIVGGRLHRMAFKRRQNLVRKCSIMYNKLCDIILALRDYYRLYHPSRINEKLYVWVRVVMIVMCFVVLFVLFLFVYIYQTFYTCVIIYRGYVHLPHVVLPSLVQRFELYIRIMEGFSFSAVRYLSYPFRYVLDFLASLSINWSGAQVTCVGAQIPIQMLVNVVVVAVVVLVIESDLEVFWCSAFSNAHQEFRKLVIGTALWENRIFVIFRHMMWSIFLQVIPHPRSLLQFAIGFFTLVPFFDDNYHAKHSPSCDDGSYYKVDSFLAYSSTVVAYAAVLPLMLIFSQILVPRFVLDRGVVKPKRYIQKRLWMNGDKCTCGLPLLRHLNSSMKEFTCGKGRLCVARHQPKVDVFYGCPRFAKCNYIVCLPCGNHTQDKTVFTIEYARSLVEAIDGGAGCELEGTTMSSMDLAMLKSKMKIAGVRKDAKLYAPVFVMLKYIGSFVALDWLYARFAYSFGKSLVPILDPASYKFGHKLSWIASLTEYEDEYDRMCLELEWTYLSGTAATYYRMLHTVVEDLLPPLKTYITCCNCETEILQRFYFKDHASNYHVCSACESVLESNAALNLYVLPRTWKRFSVEVLFFVLSNTPFGQLYSERGRLIWKQVLLNYFIYFRAAFGWWTELETSHYGLMDRFKDLLKTDAVITHRNIFDPTPLLDEANVEDENMQVMSAVISSRLVLIQMLPYMTLLSAFAVNLCSCPILVKDPELSRVIPNMFVVKNLKQLATEALMDVGILPTWQVPPICVYLFFRRSRGVQFLVNAITSIVAVIIVFSRNTDLVSSVIILSLTLIVIQGLIASIFPFVLFHYMLFPAEKIVHCDVVKVEGDNESDDEEDNEAEDLNGACAPLEVIYGDSEKTPDETLPVVDCSFTKVPDSDSFGSDDGDIKLRCIRPNLGPNKV